MNYLYRLVLAVSLVSLLTANVALADGGDGTFLHTVNEKVSESSDKEKNKKEHNDTKVVTHEDYDDNGGINPFRIFSRMLFHSSINEVGIGYSSFSIPVANATAMSGFYFNWAPIYTEMISLGFEAYFLTGSASSGTVQMTLTPVIMGGKFHAPMREDMNFYAGIGYATTAGTVNTTATQDTGFAYELGLEYKFSPNIIANAGYKNIGIAGGSLSGVNGGINFVF